MLIQSIGQRSVLVIFYFQLSVIVLAIVKDSSFSCSPCLLDHSYVIIAVSAARLSSCNVCSSSTFISTSDRDTVWSEGSTSCHQLRSFSIYCSHVRIPADNRCSHPLNKYTALVHLFDLSTSLYLYLNNCRSCSHHFLCHTLRLCRVNPFAMFLLSTHLSKSFHT